VRSSGALQTPVRVEYARAMHRGKGVHAAGAATLARVARVGVVLILCGAWLATPTVARAISVRIELFDSQFYKSMYTVHISPGCDSYNTEQLDGVLDEIYNLKLPLSGNGRGVSFGDSTLPSEDWKYHTDFSNSEACGFGKLTMRDCKSTHVAADPLGFHGTLDYSLTKKGVVLSLTVPTQLTANAVTGTDNGCKNYDGKQIPLVMSDFWWGPGYGKWLYGFRQDSIKLPLSKLRALKKGQSYQYSISQTHWDEPPADCRKAEFGVFKGFDWSPSCSQHRENAPGGTDPHVIVERLKT
jgi:hypothetical protein